jgi:(2Fe-2S) ferredoxin
MNNKAFSLVEMMVAVAFSVLLISGVFGYYYASNQIFTSGILGENLQDGANIVLSKILEGETEPTGIFRLETAQAYMVPNGTSGFLYSCAGAPQTAPCNANNLSGELYFCQDNPAICNYNDTTARWYYVNSTGTAIIYHHPTTNGATVEQTIYTSPTGSFLFLRFSPAQQVNSTPPPAMVTIPNVIEIDVGLRFHLTQPTVVTNARSSEVSASGAATTFVLLRNHK